MRIVAGRHRGAHLHAPRNTAIRPTTDRVRESVFNILSHGAASMPLEGARVLDLFAGSGALGLEALSRGAAFCLFIDQSAAARALVRRNVESLKQTGHCKIWRRDATALGDRGPMPAFDLLFADPPYGQGLGVRAVKTALQGGWLAHGAIIVLEDSDIAATDLPEPLALLTERRYGGTRILFARYSD